MMTGGGLSTPQRLELLLEYQATVLICTPTYALRLAEAARAEGRDLPASAIQLTIHAGEPGASIPSVKARIEEAWGARCVDHAGATEVGAWGFGCGVDDHMHVNESEFLAEVIHPDSLAPAASRSDGLQRGELVLTNLGRIGSPVIRYRTGDLVELAQGSCGCGRSGVWLKGGVLGRIDDMTVVRGVNVYPSAIENIVREFPDIAEFEVVIQQRREMPELVIRIELPEQSATTTAEALGERVYRRLNLRPSIEVAPPNSLPRYELKSARFKRPTLAAGVRNPPARER
jgi:phenylacetate-CoA ligase